MIYHISYSFYRYNESILKKNKYFFNLRGKNVRNKLQMCINYSPMNVYIPFYWKKLKNYVTKTKVPNANTNK